MQQSQAAPMPEEPTAASRKPARLEGLLRRIQGLLNHAGVVAAVYVAATFTFTYPMIRRFTTAVPGGQIDLWDGYWTFWWWKKSLLELHQLPYLTQYLFHPTGVDSSFHNHSVFNMLVSLPVNVAWGPGAANNFCVMLALWLSAVGMYLLARELTGEASGAFLAGLVFAFFPQRLEQSLEHLTLISYQFMPFTLLFFLRLVRRGGWWNVVGMGVCYALNALCDWHLGLMLTLTLGLFAAVALFRSPRPAGSLLRDWAAAGLVATLVLWPAVQPLFAHIAAGHNWFQSPTWDRGIDAAFLVLPTPRHPLFGSLTLEAYTQRRAYESPGFVCYLGFTPIVLAALACWRRRRESGVWVVLLLSTLVLALGARPWWNGKLIEGLTLPFAVFEHIPVLSMLRTGHRFLILTSLALAVLAAFAWAGLRDKSPWKLVLLGALIVVEYLPGPYQMQRWDRVSPLYQQLAASPHQGAVLDIPFTLNTRTVQNMRVQTVHHRKIAGGYLARISPDPLAFIEREPALADLHDIDPPYQRPIDRARLLELGFDFVVLHKDRAESQARKKLETIDPEAVYYKKAAYRLSGIPDAKLARMRAELEQLCGPPELEDDAIAVFGLR